MAARREQRVPLDPLAVLPGRAPFRAALVDVVRARQPGEVLAVAVVGLDRFGGVNTALGRAAGDLVLGSVVERIGGLGARVGRLGGDEFAVLFAGPDGEHLGSAIAASLREPFEVDRRLVRIGASIGLACAPDDANDADALLEHADAAMQLAKERGGGAVLRFSGGIRDDIEERTSLARGLADALLNDELGVHYQPIVDTQSRRIVGIEALARWTHRALGSVSPARFLPIAEDTGLIVPLGERVLREACIRAARWQQLTTIRLTVNVAPAQFDGGALRDSVVAALHESGLDPRLLELDLTSVPTDVEEHSFAETVTHLRRLGVTFAVDDFGVAPIGLSSLRTLDVSRVKIDRSLIGEIGPDGRADGSVVAALLRLAGELGVDAVGKGVEASHQVEFLRLHGCEQMQGHLVSRALPAERIDRLLGGGAVVPARSSHAPVAGQAVAVRPGHRRRVRRAVPLIAVAAAAVGTFLPSGNVLALPNAGQRTAKAIVHYVSEVVPALSGDEPDVPPAHSDPSGPVAPASAPTGRTDASPQGATPGDPQPGPAAADPGTPGPPPAATPTIVLPGVPLLDVPATSGSAPDATHGGRQQGNDPHAPPGQDGRPDRAEPTHPSSSKGLGTGGATGHGIVAV